MLFVFSPFGLICVWFRFSDDFSSKPKDAFSIVWSWKLLTKVYAVITAIRLNLVELLLLGRSYRVPGVPFAEDPCDRLNPAKFTILQKWLTLDS